MHRRTCGNGHFKLYLNGCEHCDKQTEKFTCGAGSCMERQLLAEVQHVSAEGGGGRGEHV